MKKNTKSSITLPPKELALVEELRRKIGAETKVEVIRRGLMKLKESTEREHLREAYRKAAKQLRGATEEEQSELEGLASEGLEDD